MAVPRKETSKLLLSSTQSTTSDGKSSDRYSISTTAITSDEYYEVYCQPCDEDGARLPAKGYCSDCKEHLCRDCFIFHRKNKLSKHHTLLDAKSMPTSLQQPTTATNTATSDDLTTPCPEHSKEMIKFYCKDHKKLLCSVCVTLKHTTASCKVNYIPDISTQYVNSKEYHTKLKEMASFSEKYKKIIEDLKKLTAKSNSSLTEVLRDIRKFREEINQTLDEMERRAEDEAKLIQQSNENFLKTMETTHSDLMNSLSLSSNTIKELNTSDQANKLFVALKLAEKTIEESKRNIRHVQSTVVDEYDFKPNEAVLEGIEKEKSLGKLVPKRCPTQPIEMKPRKSSHQGQVNVKISQDKDGCQISGMVLLNPDTIIITDQVNSTVKMIDTSRYLVTDCLLLDSRPRDVTSIISTNVAVTIPSEQKVQFISTNIANKLTKKRAISVDGDCHGISCYRDKLIVSFFNPAKLQILDMDGNILTNIKETNFLRSPLHVATNNSSIFVSDWGMKSVTILSWKGEVIGSYGGMGFPSGLALSDVGTLFVCDNEKNVIEEIAEDCSIGNVVLKDIVSPYVVCWCAERKMLYYCCFTMNDKDDNFLHICKM
ncbi:uncharacterized protein LOC132733748 [Ruditapes philippinarum]|uniref:uncharacterized protein LOC132733748 n=1 Tax=Ruditapes philippinarum TaxID=129788 RepID=UPI00295AEED2|nr:uncharacterized protein LOC132733748 [Ruditapes philippinarum]